MSAPDVDALNSTLAAVLAWEATGRAVTAELWDPFAAAADDLGVDPVAHLAWAQHRTDGRPVSPSGTHGPFDGERCVYCAHNQFDLALHAVDPHRCPPTWLCSQVAPDGLEPRWASCELRPHEPGTPHQYTYTPEGMPDAAAVTVRW